MNKKDTLSRREIEILHWLSVGMTTKESAESLFISFDTAKTDKRNILRKLDARNNFELAVKALHKELI